MRLITHTHKYACVSLYKLYGELNAHIHTPCLILPGYKHPFELDEAYIAGVRADHQVFYFSAWFLTSAKWEQLSVSERYISVGHYFHVMRDLATAEFYLKRKELPHNLTRVLMLDEDWEFDANKLHNIKKSL